MHLVADGDESIPADEGCPKSRHAPGRHEQKVLLTPSDVADLLHAKKSWVYEAPRAGRIPHVKLGRYVRFEAEQVDRWTETLLLEARALRHPESEAGTPRNPVPPPGCELCSGASAVVSEAESSRLAKS